MVSASVVMTKPEIPRILGSLDRRANLGIPVPKPAADRFLAIAPFWAKRASCPDMP